MKNPIVTNATKNAALPESVEFGKPITIQLAPPGEYPQFVDDETADGGQREVVQILDNQAMETLVANFDKAKAESEAKGIKYGVLVDADHSSETSTDTAAMGWVTKLFIDPEKGLMAEIDPSSEGVEKINGKVYRFVSGAWTLDDENRPEELVSIGLTNKPNLPVAPIKNAQTVNKEPPGTPATGHDGGAVGGTANGSTTTADANGGAQEEPKKPTTKQGTISMSLKEKLGLSDDATDAEVEAAVDALIQRCAALEQVQNSLGLEKAATNEEILEAVNAVVNQCGELQNAQAEAEKAKLNAEAEALVAENEDVIPEESVEEIKEEYIEDPEKAKATVANFRRVYERAVLNAARAAKPVEQKKGVVIRNAEAKKPVMNMASLMAECGGDPAKINAAIAQMVRK